MAAQTYTLEYWAARMEHGWMQECALQRLAGLNQGLETCNLTMCFV
jgi:hypothetical protein